MTEGESPTMEQSRQLNRQLTEKVLDRAQSDPQWKQQLLDDPEAAMRSANFPETQQLQQMQASAGASQEGEVRRSRRHVSGASTETAPQAGVLRPAHEQSTDVNF